MIKWLWITTGDRLAAALRWPWSIVSLQSMGMWIPLVMPFVTPLVAQAADAGAPFSVQVVPPQVAATVPPGALSAGFTTQALNSDFTQPLPKGWLGGCPNDADGTWDMNDATGHTWWIGLWWFWTYTSCTVTQAQDPVAGSLVLDMPWPIDSSNFHYANGVAIETTYFKGSSGTDGQAVTFPNNVYYEVVARQTPILPASFMAAGVTWPIEAVVDQSKAGLEDDIIELDTGRLGNSDAALHNWGSGGGGGGFLWQGYGPPGLPGSFDPNQYHAYGLRITSDGQTRVSCSYIDNAFVGCQTLSGGQMTAAEANQRQFLNLQSFCDAWNYNQTCNGNDGQMQHLYVKSVRVWSCDSWQTTQCNRPVLNSAP